MLFAPLALAIVSASLHAAPPSKSAFVQLKETFPNSQAMIAREADVIVLDARARRFDLSTATWSQLAEFPKDFDGSDVASVNKTLVILGTIGEKPVTLVGDGKGPWKQGAGLAVSSPILVALPDGRLLAAGGYDDEVSAGVTKTSTFDLMTLKWTPGAALPGEMWDGFGTARDGRVIIVAVLKPPQFPRAYVFDGHAWKRGATTQQKKVAPSTIELPDGRLALVGGNQDDLKATSTLILSKDGAAFTELPEPPKGVSTELVAGVAGTQIITIERPPYQAPATFASAVAVLDTGTNRWSRRGTFAPGHNPRLIVARGQSVFVFTWFGRNRAQAVFKANLDALHE